MEPQQAPSALLEDILTASAAVLFVFVGFALRRYLGTIKRSRPPHETLRTALKNKLRTTKLRQFDLMATQLLSDSRELLVRSDSSAYPEARALLPLMNDCRNYGNKLASSQRFHHTIIHKNLETKLKKHIYQINVTIYKIESLPRTPIDLSTLLLGKEGPILENDLPFNQQTSRGIGA